MTRYFVFTRHDPDDDTWTYAGNVEASGAEQAIRKVAKDGTGQYVAVPIRSFRPVQVAVKQREPIITITPVK